MQRSMNQAATIPMTESWAGSLTFLLAEQLRYALAIWDMLEAGPRHAGALVQLDELLEHLSEEALEAGCREVSRALRQAREALWQWAQLDNQPTALTLAIRTHLGQAAFAAAMAHAAVRVVPKTPMMA
ncbi:MAG: hypothetical protein AB4911_21015 [Oscillochloridaceae bacterium umkhey_bin13]